MAWYYVMIKDVGWLSSAPRYIELCLLALLAWGISSWWLGQSWEADLVEPSAMGVHRDSSASLDVSKLTHAALFGKIVEGAVKKKAYKPAVASALRLKLLATVVAGRRSAAIVLLEGSSKQQVFILGDAIQAGVTLKEVEELAIVVSHQGRLERIALQQAKSLASSVSVSSYSVPTKHSKTKQKSSSRKYVQKQAKHLSKLLQQGQASPYMKNGKLEGFIISNIASGTLNQTAGLQNGDIVRKVNGQPVTGTKQGMAMYKKLQNESAIDLDVLRHGAIVSIHYNKN